MKKSKTNLLPSEIFIIIGFNKVGKEIVGHRETKEEAMLAAQFIDEFHDGEMPPTQVFVGTLLER